MQRPIISRRRSLSLVVWMALISMLIFVPGLTQCNQTCFDVDEEGNRTEFPCTTCVDEDTDPCTANSWRLPPGSTCSLDQRPTLDDGSACGDNGTPGVCVNGICEPTPVLAAGFGSTTWRAMTTPPGGGQFITGGCVQELPVLQDSWNHDTVVKLDVFSDGAGNVTLRYTVTLQSALLFLAGSAIGFGGINLEASLTGATPPVVSTSEDPASVGVLLGALIDPLGGLCDEFLPTPPPCQVLLSTAGGQILETTISVTPTSFDPVAVNWSGQFDSSTNAGPMTQSTPWLDETDCAFDIVGSGVQLAIGGCTDDTECDDGRECTLNRCDVNTNRCKPAFPINEGGACDPGTGVSNGVCMAGSCRIP